MGTMITYGGYVREEQRIRSSAARVMLADLLVSLPAGVAIFPAVFTFGLRPGAGPALLFITIPAVVAGLPQGQPSLTRFFALAAIAATGAMLSLMEVPVTARAERTSLSRPRAALPTTLALAAPGAPAARSGSAMAGGQILGRTCFDTYDALTSNLPPHLGGLAISLFAGWAWGDGLRAAITNGGAPRNGAVATALSWLLRLVTPALVLVLRGLGLI